MDSHFPAFRVLSRKAPARELPRQRGLQNRVRAPLCVLSTESEPRSASSASHPSQLPRPASLKGRSTFCPPWLPQQTHIHTAESPASPRQACKGQAVMPADRRWGGAGWVADHCCSPDPSPDLPPPPFLAHALSPSLPRIPEITALALGIQKDA